MSSGKEKKTVRRASLPDTPINLLDGIIRAVGGLVLLGVLFRFMPTWPAPGTVLVWAVVCSVASGALWVGLVHLCQKNMIPILRKSIGLFGGDRKEPNGVESLIWTVVVFGPLTLAAFYLTSNDRADHSISAFIGYFVGTALGAFVFYGYGFRDRILSRNYSYFKRETWLVFLWVVLLAVSGFVGHQIGLVAHGGWPALSFQRTLTQIILVVTLVWSVVTGFVALIPGKEHENVRGLWAGGFLALGSLTALLVVQPADLFHWLRSVFTQF
jgi:hypothetical protein